MKKSAFRFERRKHEMVVSLDRRKHDDDLAERMVGGVRTWTPRRPQPPADKEKNRGRN